MVLTKNELIGSLQNEARILLHLVGKAEPQMLDYRPTPKQRSSLELMKYLTIMGPALIDAVKAGNFDRQKWSEAEKAAAARSADQTKAALAGLSDHYATALGAMSDDEFRGEIEMFGQKASRGAVLVNMVLAGHAAYRTQLFCYLKSCGREELGTMNLWAGMDAPEPAPTT